MPKILYNVTVKVAQDIVGDWLQWMTQKHILDVMETGCFEEYRICKLLLVNDEDDGITYAIQYTAPSMKELERYQQQYARELQRDHTERYKGKFVAFRTLLEIQDAG